MQQPIFMIFLGESKKCFDEIINFIEWFILFVLFIYELLIKPHEIYTLGYKKYTLIKVSLASIIIKS